MLGKLEEIPYSRRDQQVYHPQVFQRFRGN